MITLTDEDLKEDFNNLVHILHDLDPDEELFFFRLLLIESFIRYLFFILAKSLPDRQRIFQTASVIDSVPSSLISLMKQCLDYHGLCESLYRIVLRCNALSFNRSTIVPCSISSLRQLLIDSNLWDPTAYVSKRGNSIFLRHKTFGITLCNAVKDLPNFDYSRAHKSSLASLLEAYSLSINSLVNYYQEAINPPSPFSSIIPSRSFPPVIDLNLSNNRYLSIDSNSRIVLPIAPFSIEWDAFDILLRLLSLLSTPEASVYYQDDVLLITLPRGVLIIGSVIEQSLRPFESYYYRFPLQPEMTINPRGDRHA